MRNNYDAIITRLWAQYRKSGHPGASDEPHLPLLCQWCAHELPPSVSYSTWSLYRNSLLWGLSRSSDADLVARAELAELLRSVDGHSAKARTSTLRTKGVPEECLHVLEEWLRRPSLRYGVLAADWLRCSILCGLRPAEWRMTTVVDAADGAALLVHRVKMTRTAPPTRTIPLGFMTHKDRAKVLALLRSIRGANEEGVYAETYRAVVQLLRRANAETGLRAQGWYIGLYSGRHQFKQNLMLFGLPAEEIAVLMGQINLRTQEHYGSDDIVLASRPPRAAPNELHAFTSRRTREFQG